MIFKSIILPLFWTIRTHLKRNEKERSEVFVVKKIALCMLTVFYFLSVGYATNQEYGAEVKVTAVVDELPVEKIEVSYNGTVKQGEELNKNDFSVIPFFRWVNGSDVVIVEGTRVNSNEFTITPSSIEGESGTIRVTYKNVYYDVLVNCANKGQLTIKTDGLKAKLTVEAIKQVNDDDILNDGKDITYTIQSEDKTDPISDNLSDAIEFQKENENNLEILKAYEIQIKKDVTGEGSTTVDRTNEDIYITLGIPEEYRKANRIYWMAHEHENTIELLKDMDNDPDTITIQTSSFSSYVLYCTDKPSGNDGNQDHGKGNGNSLNDEGNKGGSDNSEEESIPQITDHTHDYIEIIKKSTCEEAGYRDITCKICASHKRTLFDPLGHYWEVKQDENGNQIKVCIKCGKVYEDQSSSVIEITNLPAKEKTEGPKKNSSEKATPIPLDYGEEDSSLKDESETIIPSPTVYEYEKEVDTSDIVKVDPEHPVSVPVPIEENNHPVFWVCGSILIFLIFIVILILLFRRKRKDED